MTALQRLRAAAAAARAAWKGEAPRPASVTITAEPKTPDFADLRRKADAAAATGQAMIDVAGRLNAALNAIERR